MIRDLEAILLSVVDPASRALLRESVQSYHAGSYRAAIVMAVVAGMDDLRRKLKVLASSGGAPQAVVEANDAVEDIFAAQKPFERTLISTCEKEAEFLSPSEAKKVGLTLDLRHLCAHASGHRATAEEAREVICSMTDLILSRPALMGMVAVKELVNRIKIETFYPNTDAPLETVRDELKVIHPAMYRALAAHLFEQLRELATEDEQRGPIRVFKPLRTRIQVRLFLVSMTQLGGDARECIWNQISRIVEHKDAAEDVLILLDGDPDGLTLCSPLDRNRCLAVARRALGTPYARRAIRQWSEKQSISDEERDEIIHLAKSEIRDVSAAFELGWREVVAASLERLSINAADWSWDRANHAIRTTQSLPDDQASHMTIEQQARYVLSVASHKRRSHPAHEANSLFTAGLGPRTAFLGALLAMIHKDPLSLLRTPTDWCGVRSLMVASGRSEAVPQLLDLLEGREVEWPDGIEALLTELRKDPALTERAARCIERLPGMVPKALPGLA